MSVYRYRSLVIAGFGERSLYNVLDTIPNAHDFSPCILAILGYGDSKSSANHRLPIDEIVIFV